MSAETTHHSVCVKLKRCVCERAVMCVWACCDVCERAVMCVWACCDVCVSVL